MQSGRFTQRAPVTVPCVHEKAWLTPRPASGSHRTLKLRCHSATRTRFDTLEPGTLVHSCGNRPAEYLRVSSLNATLTLHLLLQCVKRKSLRITLKEQSF